MLGVVESIALVLEVSIFIISLSNLFGQRLKVNVYTIVLVIVYLFIFGGINVGEFPTYISFLAYAAIFVYGLFTYKKSIRITFINFLLSFVIVGLLQLILSIPVFYVYDKESGVPGLNSLLVNLIGVVALLLISKKIKLKTISEFIQQKSWILKTLFVFIILYLFINIFRMQANSTIEGADYIQITCFIVLFFLVTQTSHTVWCAEP